MRAILPNHSYNWTGRIIPTFLVNGWFLLGNGTAKNELENRPGNSSSKPWRRRPTRWQTSRTYRWTVKNASRNSMRECSTRTRGVSTNDRVLPRVRGKRPTGVWCNGRLNGRRGIQNRRKSFNGNNIYFVVLILRCTACYRV